MQWLLDLLRFNRFSETKFIAVLQLYEFSWVYQSVDVQSYTQVGQPSLFLPSCRTSSIARCTSHADERRLFCSIS